MEGGLTKAQIGARLDNIRWSGLHTTILVALGAGWLFDSFEVQMFSSAVGPLGNHFRASVFERDVILAVWLAGIMIGALTGGRLTDWFGRRRLFVATLVWYAGFTVLTGLSPSLGFVYVLRFLAALGVGAEYSIVNAAIAELMPARVRGRVNSLVMNFWPAGAVLAGFVAYVVLDTLSLSDRVSWRYMFVLGGAVAFVVLWFRRRIPESPRWLVSKGRTAEAELIVSRLEEAAGAPCLTGSDAADRGAVGATDATHDSSRSQTLAPWRASFSELVKRYPGRLALGAALDLAEAFGYYGIFALLSVVVLTQVHISERQIPFFYIVGNVGGLAGGIAMSSVFERLGRRKTVTLSYSAAAAGVGLLALATSTHSGALVTAAFVVSNAAATAAWTSAYPTFTELFPTHLRGVGVGMSVAVGRIGAIVGTLALPDIAVKLGATTSYLLVVAFWLVGAAAMVAYSLRGGVDAAQKPLESLMLPARLEPSESAA